MLSLSSDMIVLILTQISYTKEDYDEDYKYNISLPARRDILQLYCTCSAFHWLSDLWITDVIESEYNTYHSTFNIFGQLIGPEYSFGAACYPEGFNGYKFIMDDSICLLKGNHLYVIMPYSNLGLIVANGDVYEYNDDCLSIPLTEILDQWKVKDPESYKWSSINKYERVGTLLIRKPVDYYYNYKVSLEILTLENESRRIKWKPNII